MFESEHLHFFSMYIAGDGVMRRMCKYIKDAICGSSSDILARIITLWNFDYSDYCFCLFDWSGIFVYNKKSDKKGFIVKELIAFSCK